MDLKKALTIANTFIILQLGGEAGTIAPLRASYDEEDEIWHIRCEFKHSGVRRTVAIEIDDNEEEVISFEIEEK